MRLGRKLAEGFAADPEADRVQPPPAPDAEPADVRVPAGESVEPVEQPALH